LKKNYYRTLLRNSTGHQPKLQDRGHGASVSHGVPVYYPWHQIILLGDRGSPVESAPLYIPHQVLVSLVYSVWYFFSRRLFR